MLKNYLRVAVRNVMRHKALSFINICGLALGMAACLLILQYVGFELSYDKFHAKKDQIYRIRNDKYKNGEVVQRGVVSYPVVAKAMQKDFPEVQNYVRIAPWIADHTILRYGDKVFREKGLLFAEPSLFSIFSFPLIKGNVATALMNPSSIVLSESKAREIFGKEEAMGKIISFEGKKPFVVTGIFKNVPPNSHLQFSMLVSYSTLANWMDGYNDSWTFNEEVYGYLQLAPGADINKLQAKLADFSQRHYQGNKVSGLDEVFILQPLTDIHLHSHFQFELGHNGNAAATWGLLGVALLIMVIAWSNYINLATARFTERAKEIGVRKVIGATIRQLLHQFMVESLLVSLVSFALAVTVFIFLNPFFLQWLGLTSLANIPVQFYGQSVWFWATLLFGLGALMSGLYPVLVLPSYKTVTILKGRVQEPSAAVSFRKVLVVYQFAITISLIAFTSVAYQQVRYMLQQDLGVQVDGTLVVWGPMGLNWTDSFKSRMLAFEKEIKNIPGVKEATNSKNVPGDQLGKVPGVKQKGQINGNTLAATWVGNTFFDLYGLPLVAGRAFIPADTSQNKVILNQSALKVLGFREPQDAIGKKLDSSGQEIKMAKKENVRIRGINKCSVRYC